MAKKKAKKKEEIDEILDDVDKDLDEDDVESPKEEKSFLTNPKVILTLLVLAIIAFIAWQAKGLFVAAMVNSQPITRMELLSELEQTYGNEVLDNLISQKLVEQEADERGITVSEEEIDSRVSDLRTNIEQGGSTLEDQLALQGQTEEELREGVRLTILVEKMFEEELEITDEDVREFYEQNQALYGEAEYDEIQGMLREQIVQQRLSGRFSGWLQDKKEEANIRYFVDYAN